MKSVWHHLNRNLNSRIEAELNSKKIPFRNRIDIILLLLFIIVVGGLFLLWFLGILVGNHYGIFNPSPISPLKDPRILRNIYDNISVNPILDAVYHHPEGLIYFSQQNGSVHSYHPSTRLWHTENPFRKKELANPEIILLRSGEGRNPISYDGTNQDNWIRNSLWGLTAYGGLVRRLKGKWQIVISDTQFRGISNYAINHTQLTTAAISLDQKWLVVGTQQEGIGVYHIPSKKWIPVPKQELHKLLSPKITHIKWCKNQFWLGGPLGLTSLKILSNVPKLEVHQAINGTILDMDIDFQERLWILDKYQNSTGSASCLRLSRYDFQYPHQPPISLINEGELFSNLNLNDLHFARYWQDRLILAGNAGIYSYETHQHRWNCHFKGNISVTLPFKKGNGFFFGFTGGIGTVSDHQNPPWENDDQQCKVWMLPYPHVNERIYKIHHGNKNQILALSMTGKLFGINVKTNNVQILFQTNQTSMKPEEFQNAVSFGDNVIFIGEKQALLHNIVNRIYKDIPKSILPEWIQNKEIKTIKAGDQLYAAVKKKWNTHIYRISVEDASATNFHKAVRLDVINGNVKTLRNWNNQGVIVLSGEPNKRLIRYSQQKDTLMGIKITDMNHIPFIDVAPQKNGIIVALADGLREYNQFTRNWGKYNHYYGNSPLKEVVQCKDRIWTSTQTGQLLELTAFNKFENRIGSPNGFDISDSQLSDALFQDNALYLAGNGRINRYDPVIRQITDRWNLPGNGNVKLITIIRNQPLALTQGRAVLGSHVLDESAGNVQNLFVDKNHIWTLRQKTKQGVDYKYLKRYLKNNPSTLNTHCFFFNPFIGKDIKNIIDAIALPDGILVLSTPKGLYFYSPFVRSWYPSAHHQFSSNLNVSKGGMLYILGKNLIRINEDHQVNTVHIIDLDSLQIPSSSSTNPVIIKEKSLKSKAVALDPEHQQMAMIKENGSIIQWVEGLEIEILPPPGKEPQHNSLKRIFYRQPLYKESDLGSLIFSAEKKLHRYDLRKRTWSEIPLDIPLKGDLLMDIDVTFDQSADIISAKTTKGNFYIGIIPSPSMSTANFKVEMNPLYKSQKKIQFSPLNGNSIRDIQIRGEDKWTFILNDQIKYFDPKTREWTHTSVLSKNKTIQSMNFYQIKDRGIILIKDENNQEVWWVARQKGPHPLFFSPYIYQSLPGETTALDSNGSIWRLMQNTRLINYQIDKNGNYIAVQEASQEPFALESQNIQGVYEWPGYVLFETSTGLKLLDKIKYQEIQLPTNIKKIKGIIEIINTDHQLWIRSSTNPLIRLTAIPKNLKIPERIKNLWKRHKKFMVQLPNGQEVYDPIIKLLIDDNKRLLAQRPSGNNLLALSATIGFNQNHLPNPLDVNWLKWNRNTKTFSIKTSTGIISQKPNQIIIDNQLIFEEIDALTITHTSKIIAANKYGIWSYSQKNLDLNDPEITFIPMQWNRPYGAAHGYFITLDKIYNQNGKPIPSHKNKYQINIGDLSLTENIQQTGIQGQIKYKKGYMNAFDQKGFIWDHNKTGLAYTESGLMVVSAAGLHPISGYTGFEILPMKGKIYSTKPDEIYSKSGNIWYQRKGVENWPKCPENPLKNRVLIDNPNWKWERTNNQLKIQPKGKPYQFQLISKKGHLAFSSDLVQGADIIDNQLIVMTEAFLESAYPTSQLSHMQATRLPPISTSRLYSIRDIFKGKALVLKNKKDYYIWDKTLQYFKPADHNSLLFKNRILTSFPGKDPRLRFTYEVSSKKIKKSLKVDQLSNSVSWISFQFKDNHFPFDWVTSIASKNGELYVGSKAGLQIYAGDTHTDLPSITKLYALNGNSSASSSEEVKVGIPLIQSDSIVAYSKEECIIKPSNSKKFHKCLNPKSLAQRLRLKNNFWRFINNNGELMGQYQDQHKQFSSAPIAFQQGYLPHDDIKDIMIYNNQIFTLWGNGWITRYNGISIEINSQAINYNLETISPKGFLLLDQALYLEGPQRRIWCYDNKTDIWQEIDSPNLLKKLFADSRKHILVNRRNLRLIDTQKTTPSEGSKKSRYYFEYRGNDDQWYPIEWENNRLKIDQWSEFLFLENKLWAATPLGLISFSLLSGEKNQKAVLAPDDFKIILTPQMNKKIQEISDIEVKGPKIFLRCESNSKKVFQGKFDSLPQSINFKPLTNDPFEKSIQVPMETNGFWEWKREGNKEYHQGYLKGEFLGETLQLVGGRFTFDSINSIAFFKKKQLEIATDNSGWYSIPFANITEGELSAKRFKRPKITGINSRRINKIRTTQNSNGEIIIGLHQSGEGFIRINNQGIIGKTKNFPQFLGSDGFWNYQKMEGKNKISITSLKGSQKVHGKRIMENGRFSDDIVLGLPVSQTNKQGIFLLIPTKAGVLSLDEQLKSTTLIPNELFSLNNGEVPHALHIDRHINPNELMYINGNKLEVLSKDISGKNNFKKNSPVPDGSVITAIEEGEQDFIRFRWKNHNQRGWSLVNFNNEKPSDIYHNTFFVNVKNFNQFKKSNPTWMKIKLLPHHIEFLFQGGNKAYKIEYPDTLDLINALLRGNRLFIIGRTRVWEIELEHAMMQCMKKNI